MKEYGIRFVLKNKNGDELYTDIMKSCGESELIAQKNLKTEFEKTYVFDKFEVLTCTELKNKQHIFADDYDMSELENVWEQIFKNI